MITYDIKQFQSINVIDSCSILNLLSTKILSNASINANCHFGITRFVEYECIEKPKKNPSKKDAEMKSRIEGVLKKANFQKHSLSIEDLQDMAIIEKRKKLGKGELSSIAFAKKTRQVFMTDDQRARKIAKEILGDDKVQTIPHLLGWLFFNREIIDSDLEEIIKEHKEFERPLEKFFRAIHLESLRVRSMGS